MDDAMPMKTMRAMAAAVLAVGVVLLPGCSVLQAPAAPAGQRVALVIGNAAYTNAPALANPVNDVDDICAALRKLAFSTTCLKNLRDRAAFDAAVREHVERINSGGVGVVYYSGHGVQVGGRNHLVPTQADAGQAKGSEAMRALYPVDELFERLRRKSPRYQLVVLDACRTELFRKADGASAAAAPRSNLVRALADIAGSASGVQGITEAPPETTVLYATGSGQAAYDGDGRNGPLTKHVLQHLGTRGIEQAEFLRRVREGVVNETTRSYASRQTPYTYGSFNGRFCFAGCPGVPDPGFTF
jgi:uncharacterized caspase-like protein